LCNLISVWHVAPTTVARKLTSPCCIFHLLNRVSARPSWAMAIWPSERWKLSADYPERQPQMQLVNIWAIASIHWSQSPSRLSSREGPRFQRTWAYSSTSWFDDDNMLQQDWRIRTVSVPF
jgi:hypothetical protein